MRNANDLSPEDLGVFIVREEMKKDAYYYMITWGDQLSDYDKGYIRGTKNAVRMCNDLLDIATLGDIASTKEQSDD